jgi:hypothetical protein
MPADEGGLGEGRDCRVYRCLECIRSFDKAEAEELSPLGS